jgi:hypothetical protein
MTSVVVRNGEGHTFPGGLKEIIISCDRMSCDKSVNDSEVHAGGGLKKMGWTFMPINGTVRHYCPEHSN